MPTVQDLPVSHVIPFLKLLEKQFRTVAGYEMSRVLRWILPVLKHHMPYLTSIPDLNSQLGSLLEWMNHRTSQLGKLMALQGKMTLIIDQMDRRSNPLLFASKEPEIVFHPDKADSDSNFEDDEDLDSDAGDSDNSWWEEDDEDKAKLDVEMEEDSDEDEGSSGESDDNSGPEDTSALKRPRTADSDESSEDSDDEDEMDIG
ncbi:hypothetical protein L596_027621 [Steinernema carpocapsae]|uniref:Small-subunit processome Utp12 domain-containing protein n=1 Tax=Steinernema carpocapsae TaxID=34508 RepID=A0A4V6XVM4_STECR|nr:hypothetical protein L596_027621 [Steinernema carpocapsae]